MTTDPRPLVPTNPEGQEEIARKLLEGNTEPQIVTPSTQFSNSSKYIILPEQTHKTYSYPDLLVAMDKSLHNTNWNNTQTQLHQNNSLMLTIRQYADLINLLKSGNVRDGTGTQLPQPRINEILDEILTVRDPWRSEWLDAKFTKQGKKWNITYHKIQSDGSPQQVTEQLEECLRKDKKPGISLEHWLQNATPQGLPPKNTPTGDLYYWHPRDGAVARFWASSDGAFLYCLRYPQYSDSGLGVREARVKN